MPMRRLLSRSLAVRAVLFVRSMLLSEATCRPCEPLANASQVDPSTVATLGLITVLELHFRFTGQYMLWV